jgi:LmbE family N-acetylglucosaminyl deacetylase
MADPAARPLNILAIGAHPDDFDSRAGGTAALYARAGHRVKFVSLTNGDAGHHEVVGPALAARRHAEAQAAARVLGLVEYQILDHHDGELEPTLANRQEVIGIIRAFQADLVLSPRPIDYHPDHRYAALLVQDAAYMVTVPSVVPEVPHLRVNPTIVYVADEFQKPAAFAPDVVVGIDEVVPQKLEAMHCHTSQMYEWLPYNANHLAEVPPDDAGRRAWLARRRLPAAEALAHRHRDLLIASYGLDRGSRVRYAEAFEGCEYGTRLTPESIPRLFPFFAAESGERARSDV